MLVIFGDKGIPIFIFAQNPHDRSRASNSIFPQLHDDFVSGRIAFRQFLA